MSVSATPTSQGRTQEHWVALLAASTLVSTILLILMGSIVRVTGHGLGCPDWPLCYGQPIPPFIVGAWFEFTHRVIGAIASAQILALGWIAWRRYSHVAWLRVPGIAVISLLVLQIPLGGIHVLLEIPPVTGLIHTAFALAIVGLVALMYAILYPGSVALRRASAPLVQDRRFVTWTTITMVLTYVLLLTGSLVTRTGASLACPAFPWCGVSSVSWHTLIWIQMIHRYAAFTVAFFVLVAVIWILRRPVQAGWRKFAYVLLATLVLQFALGIANVLLRIPMWSRALHLTVAATLWVLVVILWSNVWLGERRDLLEVTTGMAGGESPVASGANSA